MKKYIKEIIILILQLFMFYILPLFAGPTDAMGMVFLIWLSTIILGIILAIISTNKIKYFYSILISMLFIPSVFIYYNESALIHSIWYLVSSSCGILVGSVIKLLIGGFMSIKLFLEAIIKFILGVLIIGLLLFIPAGTINYFNGWLFMGLLFIPMFIAGIVMMIKAPNLLKSRLNAKEKEREQKEVVKLSGLMFLIGFIISGLNYRYDWIELPNIIIIIGSIIFILSYIIYAEVLRENAYLSRTVEIQKDQKVIDRGLYGIVRHPMYVATIFMFLSMPLILGSLISFIIFLVYPFIIVKRIKNEEEYLENNLKGYKEYKRKVKYKLIPFIW